MLVRLAGEKSAGVTPSAQRSAVLITGNPGYVRANPTVESFYRDIEAELERLGFSTTRDPGEPHTMPPTADLWVGHSRGVDRFRFAPEDQARVAFGAEGGVNHPEDKAWQRGQVPGEQHFIFTDAMREALARHGKESSGLTKSSVEDKLHGGAADGLPDSEFSPSALAKGEEHEREHTDDTEIAREIAKDHLEGEGEDYYDRLDRIEKDSVAGWFAGF
jgi:hypothetical protein